MALPNATPWLMQAPTPTFGPAPAPTPAPKPTPYDPRPSMLARATAVGDTPAPSTITAPAPSYKSASSGVMAGLAAGSQVAPGSDPSSAAMAAGTSALAAGGAAFVASGFNPIIGLAVGGGAGLSSLVNSYLSTKAERKRDRARKRILAEAQRKQDERDVLAREDALAERGYNREQAAMQTAWTKNQANMQRILETVNANQALKDRWVQMGRV